MRSVAFATGPQQRRDKPVQQAAEPLEQLNARKQGKKRLGAEELHAAAQAILKQPRVEGLLEARVETTTRERRLRCVAVHRCNRKCCTEACAYSVSGK